MPLFFRVGHIPHESVEIFARVNDAEVHTCRFRMRVDFFKLPFAQVPAINRDCEQPLFEYWCKNCRHGGRIHSSAETKNCPLVAKLGAYIIPNRRNNRCWRPVVFAFGEPQEVCKYSLALGCVRHFRMELHTPHMVFLHCHNRTCITMRESAETVREGNDRITVTHPHALMLRGVGEKPS